jgi:hypothetical protein
MSDQWALVGSPKGETLLHSASTSLQHNESLIYFLGSFFQKWWWFVNSVFSFLQTFVMSLSGPVVALAGHEHQLAVVIHASNPLASGDQVSFPQIFVNCESSFFPQGFCPKLKLSTLTLKEVQLIPD